MAAAPKGIIQEGWLYLRLDVPGSLDTWNKRWIVLTLRELMCFKNNHYSSLLQSVSAASIEELVYGTHVMEKAFGFSIIYGANTINLAASNDKEREEWVLALKDIVPRAKIHKQAEKIVGKQEATLRRTNTQATTIDTIGSILKEVDNIQSKDGFSENLAILEASLRDVVKAVKEASSLEGGALEHCKSAVQKLVSSANTAAALSSNKTMKAVLINESKETVKQVAELLEYATTAEVDELSRERMYAVEDQISDRVNRVVRVLNDFGEYVHQIDMSIEMVEDSVTHKPLKDVGPIEFYSEVEFKPSHAIDLLSSSDSMEVPEEMLMPRRTTLDHRTRSKTTLTERNHRGAVQSLISHAEDFQKSLQNVSSGSADLISQSRQSALLVQSILGATQIIASQYGVSNIDDEFVCSIDSIPESKRHDLQTLLSAAKGVAAATTNLIDIMKQVPMKSSDSDPAALSRLSVSTQAVDNSLFRLLQISRSIEAPLDAPQSSSSASSSSVPSSLSQLSIDAGSSLDPVVALQQAVRSIESSIQALTLKKQASSSSASSSSGEGDYLSELCDGISVLCKNLLEKASGVKFGAETAKDKDWNQSVCLAAQSISHTIKQMLEIAQDPNPHPDDMIAAGRCARASVAQLVTLLAVKSDPSHADQVKQIDQISFSISRSVNRLVDLINKARSEDSSVPLVKSRIEYIKAEFEAQAKIARLESQLDNARKDLFSLRRSAYGRDFS